MDLNDYFDPVSMDKPEHRLLQIRSSFGGNIRVHTPDVPIRLSAATQLALFGIPEDRNSPNQGASLAPDAIRGQLYQLARTGARVKIIDLGNLKHGLTIQDTYYAIRDVIHHLLEHSVCPVIIGGTQDLTYGITMAYESLAIPYNLVTIDSRLDFSKPLRQFDSTCYLNKVLFQKGKSLFHYVNLGHQLYYLSPGDLAIIEKLHYESLGLGQIRSKIREMEPILRDADMLSLDMGAVRQSDAPGYFNPGPNGFYGEEICQVARYAGSSDRIGTFGLFEVNPSFDQRGQSALLAAQVIWYFVDGFSKRKREFPSARSSDFTKYIVHISGMDQRIVFFKSKHTDRWWMEVPVLEENRKGRILAACSYEDYLSASNQEIPDRWLKIFRKMN
jgi:formiminoglutamase